jgi:hypothetical protein
MDRNNQPLFIGRGWYNGTLHIGKVSTRFKGLLIEYQGESVSILLSI